MSTYFCSDLHGEYDLFCRLTEKIKFSSSDVLYVLWDIIDKGAQSVKLAKLVFQTSNIFPIFGNHEYYFLQHYHSLMRNFDGDDYDVVLKELQTYFPHDTEKLTWNVVDAIEATPFYVETSEFVCVHAGVQPDERGHILPLNVQKTAVLLFDRNFKEPFVTVKSEKVILFGHTPCHYANGTGKFIKTPKENRPSGSGRFCDFSKIQLDNGVSYTKMLGCLRKEDMREFYVR